MRLSQLWQQDKQDEARESMAPIYGWFPEGFDTADLREVKVLLAELSSAVLGGNAEAECDAGIVTPTSYSWGRPGGDTDAGLAPDDDPLRSDPGHCPRG